MMPCTLDARKLSEPVFVRSPWAPACRSAQARPRARAPVGHEVLARAVGVDDGLDQVPRHVLVVRQQLLGVLRQAVAAVAEAGVVVAADARLQAHASGMREIVRHGPSLFKQRTPYGFASFPIRSGQRSSSTHSSNAIKSRLHRVCQ